MTSTKTKRAREPASPVDGPTPELKERVKFELGPIITEAGQPFGFAYRSRASFESMKGLSPDEIAALRFYRTAHDRSDRSPMRCALDFTGGGGGNAGAAAIFHATPAMLDAKQKLAFCESGFGPYRGTMRAVVLDDRSFTAIAIERFGSRLKPAPKQGEPHKVLPRSNRDREKVRLEFRAGLRILTDVVRRLISTGEVEEIWVDPRPDGTAVIRRSLAAPLGRFRCWGDNVLIDQVVTDLRERFGDVLEFNTASAAIDALREAEDGRLRHLESEELSA